MFHELEPVVLTRDVPDTGLIAGDVGTVVGVYGNGGFEIEFVSGDGDTVALVTLATNDIRRRAGREILHVRDVPAPVAPTGLKGRRIAFNGAVYTVIDDPTAASEGPHGCVVASDEHGRTGQLCLRSNAAGAVFEARFGEHDWGHAELISSCAASGR